MRVTAALIPSAGRILVAQRPPWKMSGLLWEFPGGKVEPGEELEESLVREISEELCLDIVVQDFFRSVSHQEEDFSIDLYAYWCSISGGTLCLREHVDSRWAFISELQKFHLTQADRLLIPYMESLSALPDYSHIHNA
ncbi:MAG: (deoxy)nucleoside triphosphate pyrophosphohydrolase [Syntrophobacteraceae bacterium]